MKAKQLIWMMLALLIQTAIAKAQVKDSVVYRNRTYEVVREGNLTYLKRDHKSMERLETIDRKGKTYREILYKDSFLDPGIYQTQIRSVFSEERLKQLFDRRLSCFIEFSPVYNNEIIHIAFYMVELKEGEDFPLKPSELDAIERIFRETPFPYDYTVASSEIIDANSFLIVPYRFE